MKILLSVPSGLVLILATAAVCAQPLVTEPPPAEGGDPQAAPRSVADGSAAADAADDSLLVTDPEFGPPPECVNPPSDESAWGWTRDVLFDFVCHSGRWLDRAFGDEPFSAHEGQIRGYLSLTAERREGGAWETKPRFRVRVPLPNLNRRLNLTVERENELRAVRGQTGDAEPVVDTPVNQGDDTTAISFGYEVRRAIDRLLDFRIGIRARQGDLNPYVRSRYQRDYARPSGAHWHLSQSLFYRHLDGFGETTLINYERFFSPSWLFRWSNSGTVSQITDGLAWETTPQLLHTLSPERGVRFALSWSGESAAPVRLANYGYRLAYRQTLGRPWLIAELYGGQDFTRSEPALPRDAQFYAGATIEVHYGQSSGR